MTDSKTSKLQLAIAAVPALLAGILFGWTIWGIKPKKR